MKKKQEYICNVKDITNWKNIETLKIRSKDITFKNIINNEKELKFIIEYNHKKGAFKFKNIEIDFKTYVIKPKLPNKLKNIAKGDTIEFYFNFNKEIGK